jgi:hypothetical protein
MVYFTKIIEVLQLAKKNAKKKCGKKNRQRGGSV